MIINHNMQAMNTARQLGSVNSAQSKSMEKLSSGYRINRAGDDAAGLAISEKMRGQIRGLGQASRNAQDGISLIQTAEGALNETESILQRMRELSVQSANGTNTEADRTAIQEEVNQLTSEVNRIGNTTEFNTQSLLNGGIGSTDGAKVTDATSAKITAGGVIVTATALTGTLTVDDVTFDLSSLTTPVGVTDADAKDFATTLGSLTSGGTKLSDMVDITTDGSAALIFEAKSTGANSSLQFSASQGGFTSTITTEATGDPTTIERAGLEGTNALSAADLTIAADASFKITVGSESAVDVTFGSTAKTYDTNNTDANVSKSAMADMVKDINAAIQTAGLEDKVTASLAKDGKLQFISETGKDISLTDGSGTPIASSFGTGFAAMDNIDQVSGPGAQGSGFNTSFQIGANKGQSMSLTIDDARSAALGITGNAGQAGFTSSNSVTNGTTDILVEAALNVSSEDVPSNAIETLDAAIELVSTQRGTLGAIQNRLEHTISNLDTSAENLQASESRIRDVDMAAEMMEYSKNNILSQAANSMLAQANQSTQSVLQLLG